MNRKHSYPIHQRVDTLGLLPPPLIGGADFSSSEIELARRTTSLLTLTYLVSGKCNLKCPYCYTDAGKALSNELTFSECKSVIDQAKDLGAKTIWIPGSGEPFLDKNFYSNGEFPLIDYANQKGLSVTFFTNGYFVTGAIAQTLIKKNVCVITKINSFKPQIQDFLAGRKGVFFKLREGLRNLIEAGFNENMPTRLGVNTVITKQNYDEILDIFRFCRTNNIIPYISITLHGGRANQHNDLDVSASKIKNLFHNALEIDQKLYGYTWIPSPPIMADQCRKLYYDIVVTSTGEVRFCPGIPITIGSIRKEPLFDIMHKSELLHRIRNIKQHLKGKCGRCSNDSCIYGCRLEAYSTGDLFGEDPSCWRTL
ncbi:MAG: radical SAM protein [Proteobacteria bacterium]|nr:radical SAM protein [Pseudomonadota bacterium]MBU4288092.1 radical SAM protein [Pseudomonadota bacterium]MCG2829856.1 radical SAM protein [Desulfobacteraceae bacterium]